MSERRYTDDEVQRILARAAEHEAALAAGERDGWTLEEIQRVGAEAGLPASVVAAAAIAHDRAALAPREPRPFGLPISVTRAVPLERPLGDEEWRRLVAELRATFDAEGEERASGARREWRNGNLRIVHEPAGSGAFLELRTRKGDASLLLNAGAGITTVAAALAGVHLVLPTGDERGLLAAALAAVVGVATAAVGAFRIPRWAGRRARQFEAVGALARRLASGAREAERPPER